MKIPKITGLVNFSLLSFCWSIISSCFDEHDNNAITSACIGKEAIAQLTAIQVSVKVANAFSRGGEKLSDDHFKIQDWLRKKKKKT